MNHSPDPSDDAPLQAAALVRAVLERHGLPKRKHASFVSEFFNLSRAASHQRVTKNSAWTLEEFQALASRFGEPLGQVLGTNAHAGPGLRATLRIGGMGIDCRIWLANEEAVPALGALVARKDGNAYVVVPATAATLLDSEAIRRIEITEELAAPHRVAVLDADRKSCELVCRMLREAGMDAKPFDLPEDLLSEIGKDRFDGYVVDWPEQGPETVIALLAAVRSLAAHRALVLLTGAMRGGASDPLEIGTAMTRFKVHVLETPVLAPMLVSALMSDGLDGSDRAT